MKSDHPSKQKQFTAITTSVLAALLAVQPASAQTALPPDVMQSCTVQASEFANWFAGGSSAKDGLVVPANSLAFGSGPDCNFYKWSVQMFLWLTSPRGPGKHVFSSSQFYGLSVPAGDKRKLIPQDDNTVLSFAPSISLVGDKGLDVVADSKGTIRNVVRAQTGRAGSALFRDKTGKPIDVARVAASVSGKPLLLDDTNKVLDVETTASGAPVLSDASGKAINLADETVTVDGVQRLLTTSGDVVELGQAGGGAVLVTRNNGLVYYLLQVNDVFAYFSTGATDGKFSPVPTEFPSEASLLSKITDVARNAPAPHARPGFQDSIALAMELKSSWVEASTLSNPQDYLTIKATVPGFDTSNPQKWVHTSPKTVDLALVGFHVVGSALGHPEMIWATFEHVNNAPNQKYVYKTTLGAEATVPADGSGSWLFSSSGASSPASPRMTVDGNGDIVASGANGTIGAVDVTRANAWGTPLTDTAAVANNTNLISINRSILGQMPAGDVRSKYIMIGSTWTSDGKAPAGANVVGTKTLANSTMETFKQNLNCLSCHRGDMLGTSSGGGLSHVWGLITPLFP
ncbi:hypothetical protein [Bradyrhizobium sp. CCGB20]|uniref:hypothetical protein n=1 Tax=Bradyrhizobium sp. CCGB20 TaxID=2949633 RepID=UPI0020B3F0A3|nr:hypothetical protein [Bradyrhizobium sp. CCGB20]MCP3402240.1 hypothetical protein [Bradyrhizobium sp. CCGB20]